jgi:hypothetical protein
VNSSSNMFQFVRGFRFRSYILLPPNPHIATFELFISVLPSLYPISISPSPSHHLTISISPSPSHHLHLTSVSLSLSLSLSPHLHLFISVSPSLSLHPPSPSSPSVPPRLRLPVCVSPICVPSSPSVDLHTAPDGSGATLHTIYVGRQFLNLAETPWRR